MTPTVFKYKNYRFFFFSREEKRKHIHVYCSDGEAKFWIEPEIELAKNHKLTDKQLSEIEEVIEERENEIQDAWDRHFRN